MRYRLDFSPEGFGYISYDESEKDKAFELWRDERSRFLRIRRCENIHDSGTLLEGSPVYEEHIVYGLN